MLCLIVSLDKHSAVMLQQAAAGARNRKREKNNSKEARMRACTFVCMRSRRASFLIRVEKLSTTKWTVRTPEDYRTSADGNVLVLLSFFLDCLLSLSLSLFPIDGS